MVEAENARDTAPTTYFPWFDWLRFVLASTVMLSHFGVGSDHPNVSNFAVQVFFALSGWLIGGILLANKPESLPRFYFNRAIRIWLPYYLAVVFLAVASALKDPITSKWIECFIYNATFVWNLFGIQQLATSVQDMPLRGTGNHFWSVNAEEQFYLLAPLLLVCLPARIGKSVLLWGLIGMAAVNTQLYGAIVLGVFAAVVHHHRPGFLASRLLRVVFSVALGIGVLSMVAGLTYERIAPACAVLIVLLLARAGRRSCTGAFFGGLSYQLYLNHWIGGFVATVLLIPFGLRQSPLVVVLAVPISVGLAALLYRFIDRPLLERRAALFTFRRGLVATATGYTLVAIGIAYGIWKTGTFAP